MYFGTDRLVLVTAEGHPLSRSARVAFLDTLEFQHVTLHEGSALHMSLNNEVEKCGKSFHIRVQMRSFEAMCRMIEAGVGVGILPIQLHCVIAKQCN